MWYVLTGRLLNNIVRAAYYVCMLYGTVCNIRICLMRSKAYWMAQRVYTNNEHGILCKNLHCNTRKLQKRKSSHVIASWLMKMLCTSIPSLSLYNSISNKSNVEIYWTNDGLECWANDLKTNAGVQRKHDFF